MAKSTEDGQALQRAILGLFKPIVRFALKRGFRFQEQLEVLKTAILDVADEELSKTGQASNASRLSVLTGLQRKEISRGKRGGLPEIGSANLLNRIIGQWKSDSRFSAKGKACPLTFEGADSEFADLVRSVSVDTNPYTVLFGLEQSEAVVKEANRLILVADVYNASKSVINGLQILGQDSSALHSAVAENLFDRKSVPNLHITTSYDNVCVEHLHKIREWLLDRGSCFHEEIREFLAQHDKDANPRLYKNKGGAKVVVSAFSFIDKEDKPDE